MKSEAAEVGHGQGGGDWAEAARLLDQAVKAGNQDPQAAYLLAMSLKHLGRTAEARKVLSKLGDSDTNICLQRGVLAFTERDFAQAGHEFSRAWEKDSASYPAAYNLMLTHLCQGQVEVCAALIAKVTPLAPSAEENRFLTLLGSLLAEERVSVAAPAQGSELSTSSALLASMSIGEETRLVEILTSLGSFETMFPLLERLMRARPRSEMAFTAYFGAALVQGKLLMDRFLWEEAYTLLAALSRRLAEPGSAETGKSTTDNMALITLQGMLGAASCMLQDFERGAWYFHAAQDILQREQTIGKRPERHINPQGVHQGAWIEQNLALAYEWQGKLDKAEQHWNRYFDYLEHYFPSTRPSEYLPQLAFEGASRLADVYTRKEKWMTALAFLQRAHRVRPSDSETLERLFHLYTQLKKHDEARRVLRRLREVRPNDPQVDLFEMDVREIRAPEDIDKTLVDIRRILQKHPGDMRVEERAGAMINNLVPALERLGEQYTHQINKVIDQMRRLPSYQINWPVVRNVMRDLEDKFFQLRRTAQKCLSQLAGDDLRRDIGSLIAHCDRKIDQCHSLGE